jgi:hypothetical protein
MGRTIAKFVLGGLILLISQLSNIFSWFRALQYIQLNLPKTFLLISSPLLQVSLLLVGIALCGTGLYEVWDLKHKSGVEGEGKTSSEQLSMLFVKMWEELPMREDLKGQHLLEVNFRSDYSKPIGVEFIKWEESGSKVSVLPLTYFMELRGIRYSQDNSQISGSGPSKMVVNPREAVKVTMRVYHTVISWQHLADRVPDHHPVGVLVLRLDGKEVAFDITYRDVRKQEVTRRQKLPILSTNSRLTLSPASGIQLLRSDRELISAIGFTVSNSHIQRRNIVANIRATFTFSHFEEETFKVTGLFGPARIDASTPFTAEQSVSLCQGDVRHLFLAAHRDALPMMAVDRTKYYTLSGWPFNEENEKHIDEVEWSVTIQLNTDSPEDDIERKLILQVSPPPRTGLSLSPMQPLSS